MSDPTTSVVKCQCGVKLRVPPNAAGKRIRCPKCGYRVEIPADGVPLVAAATATAPAAKPVAAVRAAPPPVPAPAHDESDALLSDLMVAESSAAVSAGPDLASAQKTCPSCHSPMAREAKTCVHCGHDGKAAPASAAKAAQRGTVKKLATGGGKFALGCALSAGGALLGAGIWYGIAMAANVEIGYVAWAVGLFAGFGMLWGYGKQDFMAALVATVMALGGILAAKWMIYDKVISNYSTNRTVTALLADRKCQEPFDRQGLPDWAAERTVCETAGEDVFEMDDREYKRHEEEIRRWADETRWQDPEYSKATLAIVYAADSVEDDDDAAWKKAHADALAKVEAMSHEDRVAEAKSREAALQQLMSMVVEAGLNQEVGFFKAMFGPIDAIFVLLALGTAMKVGGGQDD